MVFKIQFVLQEEKRELLDKCLLSRSTLLISIEIHIFNARKVHFF